MRTGGELGVDPASTAALADLGERGLIARLRNRLPAPASGVLAGIGDDAAVLACRTGTLLATTDALIEGVHFRRATASLREIGMKALAVNLSDIAAMGGRPRWALLALGLPATLRVADVDELYDGIEAMAGRHEVAVVGGDTCAAPTALLLSVTVLGEADGAPLRRSGARPGDAILVTGSLGASAAGLAWLDRAPAGGLPPADVASVLRAHRTPEPRVREGQVIRVTGWGTAMIDLSDGLATDLGHVARESGVGARVHADALPIAAATRAVARALGVDPLDWALSGGEDYELLFTADAGRAADLARAVTEATGTPVHRVGEVRPAAEGIVLVGADGRPRAMRPGFDHFART